MAFNFDNEVKKLYNQEATVLSLKSVYNDGKSTHDTRGTGIYALFLDNKLMKIGKAVWDKGIFTRMSQYYRCDNAGCAEITNDNRDKVYVHFIKLDKDKCWLEERRLQVYAADLGEKMPWEIKK
jgi:hypothetical protein